MVFKIERATKKHQQGIQIGEYISYKKKETCHGLVMGDSNIKSDEAYGTVVENIHRYPFL